jgi:hypothetical protein
MKPGPLQQVNDFGTGSEGWVALIRCFNGAEAADLTAKI